MVDGVPNHIVGEQAGILVVRVLVADLEADGFQRDGK